MSSLSAEELESLRPRFVDRLRRAFGFAEPAAEPSERYELVRFAILRLLGFVYFFAFLCLVGQVIPLLGHDGLLPIDAFIDRAESHFGSRFSAFLELPSLFFIH